jgi:hypothetical protein
VGRLYEYFTATDDHAATAVLTTACEPPTFRDEGIPPEELGYLEALLTGRSIQEIRADPRLGADLIGMVDELSGVAECGVMAVTDTLMHALATADATTLAQAAAAWHDEATVQGLATVARHAAHHRHRLYCFWLV